MPNVRGSPAQHTTRKGEAMTSPVPAMRKTSMALALPVQAELYRIREARARELGRPVTISETLEYLLSLCRDRLPILAAPGGAGDD
jgi:hypothetical protein